MEPSEKGLGHGKGGVGGGRGSAPSSAAGVGDSWESQSPSGTSWWGEGQDRSWDSGGSGAALASEALHRAGWEAGAEDPWSRFSPQSQSATDIGYGKGKHHTAFDAPYAHGHGKDGGGPRDVPWGPGGAPPPPPSTLWAGQCHIRSRVPFDAW